MVEASKRKDGSGQPAGFGEACTGDERINARRSMHRPVVTRLPGVEWGGAFGQQGKEPESPGGRGVVPQRPARNA